MNERRFAAVAALPASAAESFRVEYVIATARAVLAAASLLAITLDPTQPGRFSKLVYRLLLAYLLYSFSALLLLRTRHRVTHRYSQVVAGLDAGWAALISLFSAGPSSPFFLFFVFVLLGTAYRWGLRKTLYISSILCAVLIMEGVLLRYGPLAHWLQAELDLNRLIMRAVNLLVMAILVGYLGESKKQLRAEVSTIARLIGKARAEYGVAGSLDAVLKDLLEVFTSKQAMWVVQERSTGGHAFLWHVNSRGNSNDTIVQPRELQAAERESYFFPLPAPVLYLVRRPAGLDAVALDPEGGAPRKVTVHLPSAFVAQFPFRTAFVAAVELGTRLSGRLLLLDSDLTGKVEWNLVFLASIVQQVAPTMYNIYLLRRIRQRAAAAERARLARELHDGALQSLSALEMSLYLLRKKVAQQVPGLEGDLLEIQSLTHQQNVALRKIVQQTDGSDASPDNLPAFLEATVNKFRDKGINVDFISEVNGAKLSPRTSHEIARIVQEALTNVVKHSRARNAVVRFTVQDSRVHLVIEDDGQGLDFRGRMSMPELDAAASGPAVIKQRVRLLRGNLTIESSRGSGTKLEITIPLAAKAAAGRWID